MSSPNPFADDSTPSAGGPQSADPLNPYASPPGGQEFLPEPGPGVGIWRNGDLVVIHQSLDFPERCIWTNESGGRRQTIKLTYSVLLGLSQGSINFSYSMSEESYQKRMGNVILPVVILGLGLTGWFGGLTLNGTFLETVMFWIVLVGFLVSIAGCVLLALNWSLMTIVQQDGPYFAIRGPREPFLRSLPKWPGIDGK